MRHAFNYIIWSFPGPTGRLALWHCGHAGAREIPRKSTWKEAARTGAGSSAKNTQNGGWIVERLTLCCVTLHCVCLKTRGHKHQWVSYQNHWSVFGRSWWSLVLRHLSDITIQKCSLPPLNCFWKLTRRATRLRLIELKSKKDASTQQSSGTTSFAKCKIDTQVAGSLKKLWRHTLCKNMTCLCLDGLTVQHHKKSWSSVDWHGSLHMRLHNNKIRPVSWS